MNDSYNTISESSEGIFKDKGSKFIAYAYPILEEQEVKSIVAGLKKQHYDARHHCYAYRIGKNGIKWRANDDGEPSGTAGKPILGQLLSYDLTNILVVVVRYFGGTLLGTSGLINAYKNATIDVLDKANKEEKFWAKDILVEFEYEALNGVMKIIKDENLCIISQDFNNLCSITIRVKESKTPFILKKMENIEVETTLLEEQQQLNIQTK